jgi:hypothetical protein
MILSWHNNPSYSDLTIALSDDRKVHVHRSVLCTANEYFKTACGVNSQFVVSISLRVASVQVSHDFR